MQKQLKKKIKIAIIVAMLILVLAAVALAAFRLGSICKNESNPTKGIVISDEATDWTQDLDNLSEQQEGIRIPGYGEVSVASGKTDWQITLANPKENDCYFKYSITINENETPIYESDLIEPGKAITEFHVKEALDSGDYDIYFHISTYSMDEDYTSLNGASVKAILHVI